VKICHLFNLTFQSADDHYSSAVCNLGAAFDPHFSLSDHVSRILFMSVPPTV